MRILSLLWLALAGTPVMAAPATASVVPVVSTLAYSAEERRHILSLGPWPPSTRRDASNRVSGQPLAIELGRRLFRDPRMSPIGYIACVTCHQPDRAFSDHKARAHGLADLPRNTPALANLSQQRWYGWGGGSDSLWMASIRPILDDREIAATPATIRLMFERQPELAACYRRVFGVSERQQPQRTLVNIGKALAAFQETLVTGRTPFDAFRDALARGDGVVAARYPAAAQRGLKLFVGAGGCVSCHQGPNFTDGSFHAGALAHNIIDAAVVKAADDAGRLDDVRGLLASPLNLLGLYNDDPRRRAGATRQLVAADTLRDQYRTPSLRNVAVTAPYLRDGRAEHLHEALQHASPLSNVQVQDLAAFLATLTDADGARRPWSSTPLVVCP